MRRIILCTAIAGFALAFDAGPGGAQTSKRGGVLNFSVVAEPPNYDCHGSTTFALIHPIAPHYSLLVKFDGKDYPKVVPDLAQSWTVAPGGMMYTFKLRSGVKFHDGHPFSSADVAFSAMEIWKPLQNFGRIVFKNLTAVDTPDDSTAIFRFSAPTPPQLIENALPSLTSVLPKHLYAGTDFDKNPHNADLIGTGPFRFVEYKQGQYYRLAKNPDYWDSGHPYLDGIVFKVSAAVFFGQTPFAAGRTVLIDPGIPKRIV